jgi:hypothetical protein
LALRLFTMSCVSLFIRDICALIITQITNNKTSIAPNVAVSRAPIFIAMLKPYR